MRKNLWALSLPLAVAVCCALLALAPKLKANGDGGDSRVERGLKISPVRLTYHRRDREEVGLGSYLINAVGSCNDCHTCPSFAPGGNPYVGQPTKINSENFLAGGVPFGPFTSANITPDDHGKPAGLTWQQFETAMRTGHEPNGDILQVMPWPILANMTGRDLHAMYEYLKAVPHAEAGSCTGAGQPSPEN